MNPELRFKDQDGKDFPDWEENKFNEISIFRRGSFPQPYGLPEWYDEHNGQPFIQVADVSNNMQVNEDTNQHISKLAESKSVFVPKGSIIITIQGTIVRVAITPYDAYVDRTLLIIQSNKIEMNKEYQIYALYNIFNEEKAKADGGILKTITKETLKNFIIPIPILEEQEKVAKLLSDIDKKIESQAILVEKLKNTKEAMLVKMFPQGDSKVPEIRFDGFSGDWEEKKLGEICQTITDGAHNSPKESKYGRYMPSVKDMTHNGFIFDECKIISNEDYLKLEKQGCKPQFNDILISNDGTILTYSFVVKEETDYVILSSIAIIRPFKTINSDFLVQFFKRKSFIKETVDSYSRGNALKRIVLKDFKQINVIAPPTKDEQEKIGQFLANLDKEIEINQKKYEKLCDVKKALLHKMFPTKGVE